MSEKEMIALADKALKARERSYAPYSGFRVGAALLCKNGKVFYGCNIENASFSPTCCAERVAFFSAVVAGERDFRAIAVVGAKENAQEKECFPCGVCRQVMSEFCNKDFEIITLKNSKPRSYSLKFLLPEAFAEV